jgi:hypothetical protein
MSLVVGDRAPPAGRRLIPETLKLGDVYVPPALLLRRAAEAFTGSFSPLGAEDAEAGFSVVAYGSPIVAQCAVQEG